MPIPRSQPGKYKQEIACLLIITANILYRSMKHVGNISPIFIKTNFQIYLISRMLKIFVRVFKFRLPFLKPLLFHQKDDRLLRNSFKSRYFAKFHSSTIPFRFSNISQNFSIRLELFSILQRDRTISLKVGKVKVIVSRIRAKRGRK